MKARFDLLPVYAVLFMVFLYGPMLLMPLFSFNDSTFATFPLKGFTTRHYCRDGREHLDAGGTEEFADAGRSASRSRRRRLPFPASLALTRYRVPGGGPILSFMMLPLVVPSIVLAVALLVIVLNILNIPLSLWTVAAGHLMICIPFAMTVLMSRLEGFDRSLEEASGDLGASGFSTFRRITLPLAMPGVISSLLLCFIISFDEFVIAFFLTGTETTLPVFLFSQLRFPNRLPGTLALGSLILIGSALLVVLAEVLRRRGAPSSNPGDI